MKIGVIIQDKNWRQHPRWKWCHHPRWKLVSPLKMKIGDIIYDKSSVIIQDENWCQHPGWKLVSTPKMKVASSSKMKIDVNTQDENWCPHPRWELVSTPKMRIGLTIQNENWSHPRWKLVSTPKMKISVNTQENMQWGTHINAITNEANKILGFFWHKGNCWQSPCSTIPWVCSHSFWPIYWKWGHCHGEGPLQSGKTCFKPALPKILCQHHHGLPGMADTTATSQESLAGDVLQIPPWPFLHRLQLFDKAIKQQTDLERLASTAVASSCGEEQS